MALFNMLKKIRHLEKKALRNIDIRTRLFVCSVSITLISIFMFFITFQVIFNRYTMKNYVEFNKNTFSQLENYYNSYIENLDLFFNKIYLNKKVISNFTVETNAWTSKEVNDRIIFLDNELNNIFFSKNSIDNIIILGRNNFPYIYSWGASGRFAGDAFNFHEYIKNYNIFSTQEREVQPFLYEKPGGNALHNPVENILSKHLNNKLIYYRTIRSDISGIECIIIFCIDPNFLSEFYIKPNPDQSIYFTDGNNNFIWSNNTKDSFNLLINYFTPSLMYHIEKINNADILITYNQAERYNLKLSSTVAVKSILKNFERIKYYSLIYAVICLFFVLTTSYYFSKKISSPLHSLSKSLYSAGSIPDKVNMPLSMLEKKISLRGKILFYFTLSTLIPVLAFSIILFNNYYNIYESYALELSAHNITQAKKNIDLKLKRFNEFTVDITYSDAVQNLLNKQQITTSPYSNLSLDKLIADIKYSKREFVSLKLYSNSGENIYSSIFFDNLPSESINQYFISLMNKSRGRFTFIDSNESTSAGPILSFARQVKSKRYTNFAKIIGYIFFYTEHEMFNNIIKNISFEKTGFAFLMDKNGDLLDHHKKSFALSILSSNNLFSEIRENFSGFFTAAYDKNKYLITYNTTDSSNLKIVGVIPYNEINKKLFPVIKFSFFILISCILLIFFISSFISYRITNPINKLKHLMEQVSNNKLDLKMNYIGKDEIGMLSDQFNSMIDRLNKLINESYQSKLREKELMFLEKEAQLNALQQQINPHFLYNTLESINWMAYKIGAYKICDIVSALGDFFRCSIAKSKEFITIKEEISHLKNYIYIQQIRYQGKFEVEWNISNDVNEYETVKLILQPIVENSIVHGIDGLETGGIIGIHGYKNKNRICFKISDNGTGMSDCQLKDLKEKLFAPQGKEKSVGIFNVHRRLKLYFDDECSFDIESKKGSGTSVSFSIPALKSKACKSSTDKLQGDRY